MKKVLIFLYYFPPMGGSGVQRPIKFVKYLKEFGWEPTVICPDVGSYAYMDPSFCEQEWFKSTRIIRTENTTPFSRPWIKPFVYSAENLKKYLRRASDWIYVPDNKKAWAEKAKSKAKTLLATETFDLIFSSAPPFSSLIAAKEISQEFKIPLVVDFRDAWTESQFDRYPTSWHRNKNQELEKSVVSEAHAITAITDIVAKSVCRNTPDAFDKKTTVIPHGYDHEDLINAKLLEADERLNDPNRLYIIHNGLFYSQRRPDELLVAFKKSLATDTAKKPTLVLQGGLEPRHKLLVQNLGLENEVIDLGYQSHLQAMVNMAACDANILLIGHKKRSAQIVTGKLYEYIGMAKPIIGFVPEGYAKQILQECSPQFLAEPYDIPSMIDALTKFYDYHKENEDIFKIPSSFSMKYSRKVQTEHLAQLFYELTT